jgi:hypothetical protein
MRALMTELVGDVEYQTRLGRAFVLRHVHPSTEVRIWEYALGKPRQHIEMSANVRVSQ